VTCSLEEQEIERSDMNRLKVNLFVCMVGTVLLALLLAPAVAQAQGAWSVVSSPSPGSVNDLNGVASVSANDVWAVGKVNTATPPLIEHWNGTSWRLVKAARQAGFLNGVTAVSTSDALHMCPQRGAAITYKAPNLRPEGFQ
jgi:hypothetical protein